jgi:Ca-activated chloride channel family protein
MWGLLGASPLAAEPPADAGAGSLYFRGTETAYAPATRLDTDVDIEVSGIVARVEVTQRFRNEGPDWVEGVYVFPLPDDAAVDRLTMILGERRIEGEITEREAAKQIYERARAAGQQASLVEQERPNLFTTSVANVAPGQEIGIEIGYLQTVAYDQGRFSLRFPMTLTPRYVPGSPVGTKGAGWSFDTTQVPDASRVTPPVLDPTNGLSNPASITAVVDLGFDLAEIRSVNHDVLGVREDTRYTVSLAAPTVPMDRDFVLQWRAEPSRTPRAAAFTEPFEDESYVLLMFLPPDQTALTESAPRELLFVIDTSGSMGGPSIGQAQAALQTALGRLTSADRFNVIEFNSTTRALYPAPVPVTSESITNATRFVGRLAANGGTEMMSAIRAALGQPRTEGYLRQIVFITDGSVGNEAALFETINDGLGEARFFTVGIGAAPNSHFMRKAAQFGRGAYLHVGRLDEVEPRMQGLFDKLEHVALTDIALDWPEAAEVYPARVPDLYRGEPVVVAARFPTLIYEPISLESHGRVGTLGWSQRIDLTPGRAPGIATVWGRRKIESVLDSRLHGVDDALIRKAVLDVALRHGLVSPYTSLVAVDRTPERSRDAFLSRQVIPNMLPAGAAIPAGAIFAALPQTATDAPLMRLAGVALAAFVLGLICIRRIVQ